MQNTDVNFLTLDAINAEIASLQKTPIGQRTVHDADRLRDLEWARRRIRAASGTSW